jgi:hypothetical protein
MKLLAFVLALIPAVTLAAPFNDFTFKSPSFNGAGYSSHVLTIENQEATRRKSVADAIQSAIDKKIAEDKNTNLSKFISNLESRIYAQISQNVATSMFSTGGNCSSTTSSALSPCGTLGFEENTILWWKSTDGIKLYVKAPGEDPITITIPLGQFQF